MARRVVLVDYGASNLLSVRRAFQHLGVNVIPAAQPKDIAGASHLVLPGVGAFGKAMESLTGSGMAEAIREHAQAGRPFFGICLGMQMMLEESEEFGLHRGLGLIPGRVVPVPPTGADGTPHKVPHIGWCALTPPREDAWQGSVLDGAVNVAMYFVHSFMAVPADARHVLAEVDYDGRRICAALSSGNMVGFQCHPEKSGAGGLEVLRRFVEAG